MDRKGVAGLAGLIVPTKNSNLWPGQSYGLIRSSIKSFWEGTGTG
jgi:hypothetical protein